MTDTSREPAIHPRHGRWLPITSQKTLDACVNFHARHDDVFICSYPKSGTTWVQGIVARILTRPGVGDDKKQRQFTHVSQVSPFFEIDAHWDLHDGEDTGTMTADTATTGGKSCLSKHVKNNHDSLLNGRRCFNTHLPYHMMPFVYDPRGAGKTRKMRPKIIHIQRDGRDCAVSFWHHLKSQSVVDGGFHGGEWDEFFDQWIDGEIVFGSWFDHQAGWEKAKGESLVSDNCLCLTYEACVLDLRGAVVRIAKHVDAALSEKEIADICEKCTFKSMRTELDKYQPVSVRWTDPNFAFIRKGEVGGYKGTFTEQQLGRFEEEYLKKFSRSPNADHGIGRLH